MICIYMPISVAIVHKHPEIWNVSTKEKQNKNNMYVLEKSHQVYHKLSIFTLRYTYDTDILLPQ